MGVDRAEAAAEHKKPAAQPPSPSPWDCGSPLYDAFELASVHRVLDTHLMALPFGRPPRRPCDDDGNAAAVLAVAVARSTRASARSRRRRRAVGAAKAATRTGKAVLRSIICGSVACGRRL